ncbi:unnamed protein product [Prunus armeniaca]
MFSYHFTMKRFFKKMNRDCEEDDESRRMKNALILGTMAEFQSTSSNPLTKPDSQNGREYINRYREDHDKMLKRDILCQDASQNDINVLRQSSVFNKLTVG